MTVDTCNHKLAVCDSEYCDLWQVWLEASTIGGSTLEECLRNAYYDDFTLYVNKLILIYPGLMPHNPLLTCLEGGLFIVN